MGRKAKSHCKGCTYRNGRSYCGHLCKQCTMVHIVATIIDIPPTCKLDSPPPKTPKVSSNQVIRQDLHCSHDSCPETRVPFGSAPQSQALHPKTWELKRQVICSKPPRIRMELGGRTVILVQMERIGDISGCWFHRGLKIQIRYMLLVSLTQRTEIYLFFKKF